MSRDKKILLIIPTSLAMLLVTVTVIIACVGSPQPPVCPNSIFLGKFMTETAVAGVEDTIPTGLVPFVTWFVEEEGETQDCPVPNGASVTLSYLCTPADGSAAFVIGPQTFTLETPTTPGFQPPGGTSVPFAVPAEIPPSACVIEGTYDVTFAQPGGGVGFLSDTGDAEIYFVPPSPEDPTLPIVSMEVFTLETEAEKQNNGAAGAFSAHQGDQQLFYLVLENNDPTLSATFNIDGEAIQAAGFADGLTDTESAYNAGNYRVANEADAFPTVLFFDETPGPLANMPGGSKGGHGHATQVETQVTLGPGEMGVVGVAQRIFGACADGSCDENLFRAEVTLADQTTSGTGKIQDDVYQTGASFAYLTDNNEAPSYPGLTIVDDLKMNSDYDAFWTYTEILDQNGDKLDEMHGSNLLEADRQPTNQFGIRASGTNIPGTIWPDRWHDQITVVGSTLTLSAHWGSFGGYSTDGFALRRTAMQITGIDPLGGDCVVPLITKNEANSQIAVEIDASGGCNDNALVQIDGTAMGTIGDLRNNNDFFVDDASCRTLSFPFGNLNDAPLLVADPPFMAFNVADKQPFITFVNVTDELDNPQDWEVTVEGPGADAITLLNPIGNGQAQIEVDPSGLAPMTTLQTTLVFTNPNAINSPLRVPLLVRCPTPQVLPLDVAVDLNPLGTTDEGLGGNISIPSPGAQYENMEAFLIIGADDPMDFALPSGSPFSSFPFDSEVETEEVDRLQGKFGSTLTDPCLEGTAQCGVIQFGDDFTFETDFFISDIDEGRPDSLIIRTAADNSEVTNTKRCYIVTNNNIADIETDGALRCGVDAINDLGEGDVSDDDVIDFRLQSRDYNTGGEACIVLTNNTAATGDFLLNLVGTGNSTFFVEPSSGNCPALGLEGDIRRTVKDVIFNDSQTGLDINGDNTSIIGSGFTGNAGAGLRINGNNNTVGCATDALDDIASGFCTDGSFGQAAKQADVAGGNRFGTNGGPAIVVESGTGNAIRYNTFAGNGRLAIDLGGDGLTPNDPGDADTGPNNLQNYPVLTNIVSGGSTTLEGFLDSTPGGTFLLQFFASDDSTTRANEFFLGEVEVTTGTDGMASFSIAVDSTTQVGQVVTSTATDAEGNTSEFSAFFPITTSVATEGPAAVPQRFALEQNYPNPFNPSTHIRYAMPQPGPVRLEVFDLLGRLVAVLVDEIKPAGTYEVRFEASNLPSGTYLYQMTSGGFKQTRTLMLVK